MALYLALVRYWVFLKDHNFDHIVVYIRDEGINEIQTFTENRINEVAEIRGIGKP